MTYPIPDAALEQHIAILGKTGSGKSNAAKTIAEILLSRGQRVCAIDPTGTWWGLRLSPDGRKPSPWPIVIFGGEHQDLALEARHGAAIAETIGTTSTSAIIDTRLMSVADRTRFFTDFGQGLLRANRGPLTLIIDEAHLFAPQGRVADPRSGEMLHAANNLVSLGRGVGLRIVLISQRPAKLHKDSLTQVETLVAMRVIAPQDRKAIEDWIGEWADPGEGREIVSSLPSLPKGDAWVWAPELEHLARAHFPIVASYDSGKPRDDDVELKPIDVAAIAERLEAVAADALANDPKRLKAEMTRLRQELAEAKVQNPDDRAHSEANLEDAERKGWERGAAQTLRFASEAFDEVLALTVLKQMRDLFDAVTAERQRIRSGEWALKDFGPKVAFDRALHEMHQPMHKPRPVSERPEPRRSAAAVAMEGNIEGLTPAKRRILVALRQLEALGRRQPDKQTVAWFAGASPKSSAFTNNLGAMRTAGLIEYPSGGTVALTDAGAAIEPPVAAPTQADLLQLVREKLQPAQMRIVEALVDAAEPTTKADLAETVGASLTSSAFTNNLGRLRSLGLVTYPAAGMVEAGEVLFS